MRLQTSKCFEIVHKKLLKQFKVRKVSVKTFLYYLHLWKWELKLGGGRRPRMKAAQMYKWRIKIHSEKETLKSEE